MGWRLSDKLIMKHVPLIHNFPIQCGEFFFLRFKVTPKSLFHFRWKMNGWTGTKVSHFEIIRCENPQIQIQNSKFQIHQYYLYYSLLTNSFKKTLHVVSAELIFTA